MIEGQYVGSDQDETRVGESIGLSLLLCLIAALGLFLIDLTLGLRTFFVRFDPLFLETWTLVYSGLGTRLKNI